MEEMAEAAARQQATSSPPASIVPVFQQPEYGGEDTIANTVKSEKARRRASLSISRFGQVRHGGSRQFTTLVLNGLHPRSQSTLSILPSARVVFLGQHPLYHRSLSSPHYMPSLQ